MLNLQGVVLKNIEFEESFVHVWLETKPTPHICPSCNKASTLVYDYRKRKIKHIMIDKKQSILHLRQRRYVCPDCGKKFNETYRFVSRYYRTSNDVIHNVFSDLKKQINFKTIGDKNGIASQSVIRYMQFMKPFKVTRELPEAIGIDEFRGNSGGNKFQVAITDLKQHKIIDIISARSETALYHYLDSITNKDKVKYVTIDLSMFFKRIILDNFKNAQIIADKFHYTRLINWGLDKVRKKVQTNLEPDMRKFFKHSRKILHKRGADLNDDQLNTLRAMLDYDENLRWAYSIKENLYEVNDEKDISKKKELFNEWIKYSRGCDLEEFNGHIETFIKWYKYIVNSFNTRYTNGITEGLNTKIKTLKRISYGFRNFKNFRLRILVCS